MQVGSALVLVFGVLFSVVLVFLVCGLWVFFGGVLWGVVKLNDLDPSGC